MADAATDDSERPAVWVGHVSLETDRLADCHAFMVGLGMRSIFVGDTVSVLELRAGTHLVLKQTDRIEPGGQAAFDLMVDDLDATHARLTEAGLAPTPIERGRIHDHFHVPDPSGTRVKFNSSHNSGRPV